MEAPQGNSKGRERVYHRKPPQKTTGFKNGVHNSSRIDIDD